MNGIIPGNVSKCNFPHCVAGKGEAIETTLAALQVVPEPFRSFANTLVDICAYAGQSGSLEVHFIDAVL